MDRSWLPLYICSFVQLLYLDIQELITLLTVILSPWILEGQWLILDFRHYNPLSLSIDTFLCHPACKAEIVDVQKCHRLLLRNRL